MSIQDYVSHLGDDDLPELMACVADKYRADQAYYYLSVAVGGSASAGNPFDSAVPSSQLPDPPPMRRFWSFCLYPETVTMLVAESGAGKSTLLYNIMIHAAQNEEALGIPFELDRPLRILYIDPENSGRTCLHKISRINQGRPDNLRFHSGQGIDLSKREQVQALQETIVRHGYDIVILDPIAKLFNTINENDNSEANRQMNSLNEIAKATGVCIIAVHHTDKTGISSAGRGAYARLAAADVSLMLRARGPHEDGAVDDTFAGATIPREDMVRLQCVKNRIEGQGSLYLQMAGDERFLPSTFAAWQAANAKSTDLSRLGNCREDVMAVMVDGYSRTRPDLFASMAHEGYGQAITAAAIEELISNGSLASTRVGAYTRFFLSRDLQYGVPSDADALDFDGTADAGH